MSAHWSLFSLVALKFVCYFWKALSRLKLALHLCFMVGADQVLDNSENSEALKVRKSCFCSREHQRAILETTRLLGSYQGLW